ncbi:MAG: type II toxin-antitoxin system VapC family toxin [Terriglobales bacterium]
MSTAHWRTRCSPCDLPPNFSPRIMRLSPVLFDSSMYISALRTGEGAALMLRRLAAGAPVWLSSVVLEELYAGVSARPWHVVERLERDFDRSKRILVPNLSDWTQTGKVLARLAAKYDYEQIGRGRLTNDALIAMSAGRLGITVITANKRDFKKLAEFRPFRWRVNNPQST